MNDQRFKSLLREMREAACTNPSSALSLMRRKAVSPIEALKILRELFGMNLADAKMALSTNPAWFDVAEAADKLHQEIIDAVEKGEE